jgi:hypothetical protein
MRFSSTTDHIQARGIQSVHSRPGRIDWSAGSCQGTKPSSGHVQVPGRRRGGQTDWPSATSADAGAGFAAEPGLLLVISAPAWDVAEAEVAAHYAVLLEQPQRFADSVPENPA